MYRLVPISLPTLFLCFCLKSLTNVNLKMKRDNELQKLSHILVFDENDFLLKCMVLKKPKAYSQY